MANGKPRDRWLTDIVVHELPTIRPSPDDLTRRALRLAGDSERRRLDDEVFDRIVRSNASDEWPLRTDSYLRDFDAVTAQAIEDVLRRWLVKLQRDAVDRGWET